MRTCAIKKRSGPLFVRMRTINFCAHCVNSIAGAIAKKESRQVNEKFSELKKEDIGMVTKV